VWRQGVIEDGGPPWEAEHATDALARGTTYTYERLYQRFRTWCQANHLAPFPVTVWAFVEFARALCVDPVSTGGRASTASSARRGAVLKTWSATVSNLHKFRPNDQPQASVSGRLALAILTRNHNGGPRGKRPLFDPAVLTLHLARVRRPILAAWQSATQSGTLQPVGRPGDTPSHLTTLALEALRGRAVALLALRLAARPSDLASRGWEHAILSPTGLTVSFAGVKDDPRGSSESIDVAPASQPDACPVVALRDYAHALRCVWGPGATEAPRPLFQHVSQLRTRKLSADTISNTMQAALESAGIHDTPAAAYRASVVTYALARGAQLHTVLHLTRHASLETLIRHYAHALSSSAHTDLFLGLGSREQAPSLVGPHVPLPHPPP
jgi:hypothetical protein